MTDAQLKTTACVRRANNFGKVDRKNLADSSDFIPQLFEDSLHVTSPKLLALLDNIATLDKKGMYKHMIFTDIGSSMYGYKIIASGLVARGFKPCFTVNKSEGFRLSGEQALLANKGNSFGILASKTYGGVSQLESFRKNMLEIFNQRPENARGDLIRIMIVDQGFKEGIDLFDLKYVHLFEPMLSTDQKQSVGRGTRFCGQSGLKFHPLLGWPLHVYKYDNIISNAKQTHTGEEMWLKHMNIDSRKMNFLMHLEATTINAAVDQQLTKNIHQFYVKEDMLVPVVVGGGGVHKNDHLPPNECIRDIHKMSVYISKHYGDLEYDKAVLKNLCLKDDSNKNKQLTFTNTQEFVRTYFTPASPYKGILLWHSVGSGKTCTAIATATTSFDRDDYTILWVTRHTLKTDIWKNMRGMQTCNTIMREQTHVEAESDNWVDPISYKQFSNMLKKNNKYYDRMVQRNGMEDPLRRTLLIIDEAHRLYSPNGSKLESPDMAVFEKWIANSYAVSGNNSVRILCMTATPFMNDGMELVRLLNLIREPELAMPCTFDAFAEKYKVDESGDFSQSGRDDYMNDVCGYVSYLDRSRDGRMFARPIFHSINVPFSDYVPHAATREYDNRVVQLKERLKTEKAELRGQIKNVTTAHNNAYKQCVEVIKADKQKVVEIKNAKKDAFAQCMEIKEPSKRRECKTAAKQTHDDAQEQNDRKKRSKAECDLILDDLEANVEKIRDMFDIDGTMKELAEASRVLEGYKADLTAIKDEQLQMKTQISDLSKNIELDKTQQRNDILKAKQDKDAIRHIKSTLGRSIKRKAEKLAEMKMRLNYNQSMMNVLLVQMKRKADMVVTQYSALAACMMTPTAAPSPQSNSKHTSPPPPKQQKKPNSTPTPPSPPKQQQKPNSTPTSPQQQEHNDDFDQVKSFYVDKITEMYADDTINDKRALMLSFHPDKVPIHIKLLAYNNDKIKTIVNFAFVLLRNAHTNGQIKNGKETLLSKFEELVRMCMQNGGGNYNTRQLEKHVLFA